MNRNPFQHERDLASDTKIIKFLMHFHENPKK
jgi:hypothetical protein